MIHTLEADGIELIFSGRKVLSDVYLKCETGKVTGLLGRNGQGKSCLMQIIYGSLSSDIKSVRFDGRYIAKPFKHSDMLVYMPQFNFIPIKLSVERVFMDFELAFENFDMLFSGLGISVNSRMGSLSGGQRRLIELYVIIRAKSQFAMLDEPFSHISPVQIEQIKKLIEIEKQKKGFLITDHMFRHVADIADNIYLLANGKVHLTSSLDDLEYLGYARL
ncbi:MAG: ATP-binding cassette domain-containing protein [Daejeonella sp.]|uniref:ATP-binding cassette domain-containing protein n=1 Tax=Daejeonella sp. TaxID=2805397 RepID=UPI003C72D10B